MASVEEYHDGVVSVPVIADGEEPFKMAYQHDLIVESQGRVRAVGSVKTSSKDRLDKIFLDKFLYNRLTNAATPHFAIFLSCPGPVGAPVLIFPVFLGKDAEYGGFDGGAGEKTNRTRKLCKITVDIS